MIMVISTTLLLSRVNCQMVKLKDRVYSQEKYFGLEHCVPSDFYKCYHNYHLPLML